jgi:hypothetical protein
MTAHLKKIQENKMNRIRIVLLTGLTISMILVPGAFAQTGNSPLPSSQLKLKIQPLNVKPGLWETTTTHKTSGAPPIPPETLAKLSREQRARLEDRMSANSAGSTNTVTDKHCVTKEDVEKADFGQGKGECTYTIQTSTSTQVRGYYSCNVEGMKVNGALDITAPDPEHIKGSSQGSLSGGSRTMNVESTFASKFLRASCGNTE